MNLLKTDCKTKYYENFNSQQLLNEVHSKIDTNITEINKEFQYIFHKMIHIDPCSYWNKNVYNQTISLLENHFSEHENDLCIDENIFNYFLMGYNSYSQISDSIIDWRNFNINQETKIRLYGLPMYTMILESCLSNFLRLIVNLIGQGIKKDYSKQNTLGKLINILKSNGFSEIVDRINVNLRNSINHGKVSIENGENNQRICFFYEENNISKKEEIQIYDLNCILDCTYDVVSAVFLAVSVFINNHLELIRIDRTKRNYVSFSLLEMKISLPGIYCKNISDTGNLKQLNVEIDIDNTDKSYIAKISIFLAIIIFEQYNDYEQYMFNFKNPRMLSGWVRYTNNEISDVYNKNKIFPQIIQSAISRKDFIIFDPSKEDIDLNEIKYFVFPNYSSSDFKINNVQDASTENRKRLRANLYIGETFEKNEIIDTINRAITWLKTLKNPQCPFTSKKYGTMPADSLYINVYKNDVRNNKGLLPSNENFVCFVDYNIDGKTTLKNGGLPENIWNRFYHEQIDNIFISWREGKYCIRRVEKIGRNDPCPCGSGKKYKKCCGK